MPAHRAGLKNQPFQSIYIDAFAGTGDRREKRREILSPEFDVVMKGSARLALEVEPAFDRHILIERATQHVSELLALNDEYPTKNIEVINAEAIADLFGTINWRDHERGPLAFVPSAH